MDVNYAPFPKEQPNTLVLNKAYIIGDKSDTLSTFNTKLSQITSSELSPEEETIEYDKLNEYIKTELSFDFVNEKDESDMISFLANIGFGKLLAKTTYSFDPSISFTDQKDTMLRVLPYTIKGVVVNTVTSKKYEFINPNYEYVENLRVKNLSMNIEFEKDGSLSKHCYKEVFILLLHLIYMNQEQAKSFEISPESKYSSQFYKFYDTKTMIVNGKEIGIYKHAINIVKDKVDKWCDFLLKVYRKDYMPNKRGKHNFPKCFYYYDSDFVDSRTKVKGKLLNFIYYVEYKIYQANRTKSFGTRKPFTVEFVDIKSHMIDVIFKKYYENYVNKKYDDEQYLTFKDNFNFFNTFI